MRDERSAAGGRKRKENRREPCRESDKIRMLLFLLRHVLCPMEHEEEPEADVNWERLLAIARQQGVAELLYDALVTEQRLPGELCGAYIKACRGMVRQNYRLLFLGKAITDAFKEAHIESLILKGSGIGAFYPVPELRKSGDVDILLYDPGKIDEACAVLEKAGFVRNESRHEVHHVEMRSPEGIGVELHTMVVEPFDNERINNYVRRSLYPDASAVVLEDRMGIAIPRLTDGRQAYALLLHMLQDYLRSGFGLKLLCDWTVFWNQPHGWTEKNRYRTLVRESGLCGFSDMVTEVCIRYLGLSGEEAILFSGGKSDAPYPPQDIETFFDDVLEAGEFGKNKRERMVTLRGFGPGAYLREFHHQMRLNYPNACRHVLLWPGLWLATLFRFLRNNRTIRHIPLAKILKKAGQRGRLTARMGLFESNV